MTEDTQLLRQYVQQGSQAAFSRLVARHLNFVYSTCLREVRDAALAEEVTQVVFLLLARKAPRLHADSPLSGWLFRTARFACQNVRRRETRHKLREQRVMADMRRTEPEENALWEQVSPVLNEALASLGAKDREAILLRFADGFSFPELSAALGTSEDAARMRLNRAVDRLRRFFAKEGVVLPAIVLTGLLASKTVQAAPALCMASVAQIAGSANSANVVSAQVHSQLQGVLKAMTISKLKLAATIAIGFALAGSLPFVTRAQNHARQPHYKLAVPTPQAMPTPTSKSVMAFLDKAVQAESRIRSGRLNLYETFTSPKDSRSNYSETSHVVFDNPRQVVMVQGTQNKTGTQVRRRFSADAYQIFTHDPSLPQPQSDDVNISKPDSYWPPYWPYGLLRGRQWEAWKSLVSSGKLRAVMVSSVPSTGQAILKLSGGPASAVDQELFVDTKHGYTLTRLQLLNKASGRNMSEDTISYKRYASGCWYPESIEQKLDGGQRAIAVQKWSISRVDMNPALAAKDLNFGPVPAWATIHDSRRNKSSQVQSASSIFLPLLTNGSIAPDFTVHDKDSNPVKLSDFRGKTVILDFWATWCNPCQLSLPYVATIAKKYQQKGVVVLAVNIWDTTGKFTGWLTQHQQYTPIQFAIDTNTDPNDVGRHLYHVGGIPTEYIIDKTGRIVTSIVGYDDPTILLEAGIGKVP